MLSAVAVLATVLLARGQDAQDLSNVAPAAQTIVDRMKAMAAEALKNQQLPLAGATVDYDLDPVTKVDTSNGKTIKMTSYTSNCPGVQLPFAIDATKQNGGKPTVIVGAIVFEDPTPPNTAVPTHVQAVHLTVVSPVAAPNLDIEVAGR